MSTPPRRDDFAPDQKQFSAIKFDEWKAPSDEMFYQKIAEFDSVSEFPTTTLSKGESLTVFDEQGRAVVSWDGPDHPSASEIPEL